MTRIIGTWRTAEGDPDQGRISLTLTPPRLHETGDQITNTPLVAELDPAGRIDTEVIIGGTYRVVEQVGSLARRWWLHVDPVEDQLIDLPSRYPGTDEPDVAVRPVPGPEGPPGPEGTPGAPITIQDPATGRLQIAGVEMGDTGVRDLSGDLLNGWGVMSADTAPRLSRIGHIVSLSGLVSLSNATNTTALILPVGFRPTATLISFVHIGMPVFTSTIGQGSVGRADGAVRISHDHPEMFRILNSIIWHTSDAWPTALPGTPSAEISALPEVPDAATD